ncbi:MAG: hypothetical protein KIT83_12120 [Bryobacterales bacterium]|nr:hypothetical protein [Bryobacterales bacterium]
MSLNISSARTYNRDRKYSVNAIWAIQRQLGVSTSGEFDDTTIKAIYAWQGSPERLTKLTKDGKLGPAGLGCMIAEMRRGPATTDIQTLSYFPHTLPPGGAGVSGSVVDSFIITNPVSVDLRADGTGWQMRGRFRVHIQLNASLSSPGRYQYRQYIRGLATSTPGRFRSNPPSLANWEATAAAKNHNADFKVPGGLHQTTWKEDGVVSAAGDRKFGYRSAAAFVGTGEEDRYLPNQASGREYVCVDTFGILGTARIHGTKLHLKLDYKGVVIDTANTSIITERTWSYNAERILTSS